MSDRPFKSCSSAQATPRARCWRKESCARMALAASTLFQRAVTQGEDQPVRAEGFGRLGYPTDGHRSKGWEEFAAAGAPVMDFVFTVCDSAAGETCPVWPGQPMTAHWGSKTPPQSREAILRKSAPLSPRSNISRTAYRFSSASRSGASTGWPLGRSFGTLGVSTERRRERRACPAAGG